MLKALREETERLLPLLPSMTRHHYRAQYVDASLAVESVEHIHGDTYAMNYQYSWYAHSACKDDSGGDIDFGSERFTYRNGTIYFEYAEPEPRYPNEEF